MMSGQNLKTPKLSICIATYNRGKFIAETIDSILIQLSPEVELVVVDGASPDNTQEVMEKYLLSYPEIRYFREKENSGVDRDFDKAVCYAKGEYCWLMTDDDLLHPDAISTVLSSLRSDDELVVVNSEVRSKDLSTLLQKQMLEPSSGKRYDYSDKEIFFASTANYLSFIGCVIIRRTNWVSRDRASYYGTLFVHVGVIFQDPPVRSVRIIDKPLIIIRYGNAMWTARSFEIWMFKWPELIWSFKDYSDEAKRKVCRREPWRKLKSLMKNRAMGSYTTNEYHKIWPSGSRKMESMAAYFVCILPASIANIFMIFILLFSTKNKPRALYDLLSSPHAGSLSHFLVKTFS